MVDKPATVHARPGGHSVHVLGLVALTVGLNVPGGHASWLDALEPQ